MIIKSISETNRKVFQTSKSYNQRHCYGYTEKKRKIIIIMEENKENLTNDFIFSLS